MANRHIPKKFDMKLISAQLKSELLYSDAAPNNVVTEIALRLGCARRTVYAILDGDIKLTLDFLHAAVLATNADPLIRQYLEPEGMRLIFETPPAPDQDSMEAECLDDYPKITRFHDLIRDKSATKAAVKRAHKAAVDELDETLSLYETKKNRAGK